PQCWCVGGEIQSRERPNKNEAAACIFEAELLRLGVVGRVLPEPDSGRRTAARNIQAHLRGSANHGVRNKRAELFGPELIAENLGEIMGRGIARSHKRRPAAHEAAGNGLQNRGVVKMQSVRTKRRSAIHPRRDYKAWNAAAGGAEHFGRYFYRGRRRHMVVETTVLVVSDDQERLIPFRTCD